MKRLLVLFLVFINCLTANAAVLEAGVSLEEIPKELFGNWRITGKLDTTNAPESFKGQSIDFWNLSRKGDTLALENPLSGARAEISVKTVEGNLIVFTKKTPYDNKLLTDIVTIRLNGNEFTGINDLKLESFSLIDNHLMKTESAKYIIKGEKISGDSIFK